MNADELRTILDEHEKWLCGNGGKRANFRGADLTGADLTGADLTGAYLRDADLWGAYLRDADLWGAYLRDAYLRGANLRGANFRDAYLRGADLTGADLTGAYLTGAYLTGADLRGAYLWGATLNWRSHDLLADLLRRAAGGDIDKLRLAGLVLISRDWCWEQFLALDDPLRDWALDTLAPWVKDGDGAPKELRRRKAALGEGGE